MPPGDITQLLREWSEGNPAACEPLFDYAYPQLRRIAGALFVRESPNHLLQPTVVVNELFLKLVQQHSLRFEDRQHFFSLAAGFMRRILIDHARSEGRKKRDGGVMLPLEEHVAWVDAPSADIFDLDRVLDELAAIDPKKTRLVELRFYMGLSAQETAEIVGISKATVDRELHFVRGWVRDRLGQPAAERLDETGQ